MAYSGSPYGPAHQRERRIILAPGVVCVHCEKRQATELDHDPPLALHVHLNGSLCCQRVPSCSDCARRQGGRLVQALARGPAADEEPVEEPAGFPADHAVWGVPWLDELRRVPGVAVWPRLMTVPHPDAVGSLGVEFAADAVGRSGRPLRWWQQLVSTRLLEVDGDGRLVWESLILSLARQLGKSWWLRELFLWRIHQGARFGEPQDVMHTGKDVAICKEVQRPARMWAKARPDRYQVREANGEIQIELLADGSRWLLRAKEGVYGYPASLAGADEAWKVPASSIEEGLAPTMVEREQAQLVLVSTAHRKATSLMLSRRAGALADLEHPESGDLLVEWSAPRDCEVDDVAAWRLASPHWSERRRRLIAKRLAAAVTGESDDPDEPDPIESFRSQWLNQWPLAVRRPLKGAEPLLADGAWQARTEAGSATGPMWVAVEDNYGHGAAVAACALRDDGRLEVDGWTTETWDAAMVDVAELTETRKCRGLLVGASMLEEVPGEIRPVPRRSGATETRTALPLFRTLVDAGDVVHDDTTAQLDAELGAALVRKAAGGLTLVPNGASHLVRAVCWAVQAAHRPKPRPSIH